MLQIQELAAAAAAWEAKAKRLLENRGGMEEFTECIRCSITSGVMVRTACSILLTVCLM